MNIKRIEFAVTYRCNSHCRHCQVGEDERRAATSAIDRDLAVEIVRRVAQAYHPSSIMTFGGESLLYPDVTCAIHETALLCEIPNRQIITNAGTPRSEVLAYDLAQRLARSGVTDMSISVDTFHQEHIPLGIVERNVRAYLAAGITDLEWNPCWVVSQHDDNPHDQHTRAILNALRHLPVRRSEGNILQARGDATTWLSADLPPKRSMPIGSCEDVPYAGRLDEVSSILIMPNGGVSICYEWIIGNSAKEDILSILESYDPCVLPKARAILNGGMAALAELARSENVEPNPDGYYSICDMCIDLRRCMKTAKGQPPTMCD